MRLFKQPSKLQTLLLSCEKNFSVSVFLGYETV